MLRTHTSAHQVQIMSRGHLNSIVLGEVFRKDEIDATHYPVFHQMEAFTIFKTKELEEYADSLISSNKFPGISNTVSDMNPQSSILKDVSSLRTSHMNSLVLRLIIEDLKETHINLFKFILGTSDFTSRWNPDFFPFTDPSFELEIYLKDRWLEVLGSGVIHKNVLQNAGIDPLKHIGWASGVGLERIAMILFDIPDIRLFWSQDSRFLEQFEQGKISKFKPFSMYPACFKDVSFYVDDSHTDGGRCSFRGERSVRSR